MNEEQVARCIARIAEEDRLAREAPNEETAELHVQKAKLYRMQLASLRSESGRTASEG